MTFDEMYDQMLNLEFSTAGRHAKADATTDPAAAVAAMVSSEDVASHARHAKADTVEEAPEGERRTGFARYRTATLVGAGGLACATVGAFLGGLGGYFTISPAGAHAVASTSQDTPLADAVNHAAQAAHSAAGNGNAALAAAAFSAVSGGLTKGWGSPSITTGYPSTYDGSGSGALRGAPILGGSGSGGSGGGTLGGDNGGTGTGPGTGVTPPASCADPLSCLIANLSGALSGVGTVPSDPTGMLSGLLTEVTGALSNLGTLLPGLPSVPGGLPVSGVAPSGGVPGVPSLPGVPGVPGVPGLPVTSAGPAASGGSSGGAGSLGSAVGAVTGAVSGATGSTAPTLPTAPLPTSPTTAPITVPTVPTAPLSTSTGTTSPVSGGLSTTITSPVPLPSTGPVTVGPVTVGTSSGSGSTSGGLTLNLGGL